MQFLEKPSARELYSLDFKRYGTKPKWYLRRFHKWFRKASCAKNGVLRWCYRLGFGLIKKRRGLEIPFNVTIGKGLYLGHPYNITINSAAVIGDNVNIHKGVTIGRENRGVRKGCPKIGSCVYIGINAIVVGNITIGDDVLIAPNSFVNCDVPSHSIVVGNPCVIKRKENATEGYIDYLV